MHVYFFLPFTFYLKGKAQILTVWLHEIQAAHTHVAKPDQERENSRCSPRCPNLVIPILRENHCLTSNLRDSDLRFLKHWVSDTYKSGNVHVCHPLWNRSWLSWVCGLPSPGNRSRLTHIVWPPAWPADCNTCLFASFDGSFKVLVHLTTLSLLSFV